MTTAAVRGPLYMPKRIVFRQLTTATGSVLVCPCTLSMFNNAPVCTGVLVVVTAVISKGKRRHCA